MTADSEARENRPRLLQTFRRHDREKKIIPEDPSRIVAGISTVREKVSGGNSAIRVDFLPTLNSRRFRPAKINFRRDRIRESVGLVPRGFSSLILSSK